ncbi:HNH endonuclease [Empedobacter brevis]|uniref:HNH endonuclease n=1 Tax=Empedobacter brevis TaxID=247 RepID=UPI00289A3739|nr:HNH endonuclease [Empedobacter brevis]
MFREIHTNPNIIKVKSIFEHVSIETFIKYFEVFEKNRNIRSNTKIYEAFELNKENWEKNSRNTRASKGKSIFKQNLEISALDYIVNFANENKLTEETILKAKNILSKLTLFKIEEDEELLKDINYIEQTNSINEETKTAMIKIRIGQSKYRNALIEYWQGCSITNCQTFEILVSSHIKSYRDCEKFDEKFDIYNGLLLTPNYDKLFDRFLISFDKEGKILISKTITDEDLLTLGINKTASIRNDKLIENHHCYLDQHRAKFEELELTSE